MDGFRGAFWTIFSSTAIVLFVSSVGLRHAGIIGNADEETREEILEEESAAV